SALGDDLSFQWYKGNEPGTEIPGATSEILTISPATVEDDGSYYVVVSGAGPCNAVTSNIVTLNVDENIEIQEPLVDQDVCIGTEVTFTILATATGGEPTFQWLKDGVEMEGKTGPTLILPSANLEDSGEYSVLIEGPGEYRCSTITSGTASLTVSSP